MKRDEIKEQALKEGILSFIRLNGCLLPNRYNEIARQLKTSKETIEYHLSGLVHGGVVSFGEVAHLPSQLSIFRHLGEAIRGVGSVDRLKPIKERLEEISGQHVDYVQLRAAVQSWHKLVDDLADTRRLIKSLERLVGDAQNSSFGTLREWRKLREAIHPWDLLYAIEGGLLCGDLQFEWLMSAIGRHDRSHAHVEWRITRPDETTEDSLTFRHWIPVSELEAIVRNHKFTEKERRIHADIYRDWNMDNIEVALFLGSTEDDA